MAKAHETTKYPNVHVQLLGEDGNIFSIIARVTKAMNRANVPVGDVERFRNEVKAAADYDEALRIVMN